MRRPGLDLLRAGAIMLVMVQHALELLVSVPDAWRPWFHFGRFGVDLFFVLSGFLIGGMILRAGPALKEPRVLAGFLVGRALRTLPLYYLILAARLVIRGVIYGAPLVSWPLLGRYVVFTQNLAGPMPVFFVESWALSVEIWFYLLLPLLVWGGWRAGLRGTGAYWLGGTVLLTGPLVLRCLAADPADRGLDLIHLVAYRLDTIAWGLIAAALAQRWPDRWRNLRVPALAAGIALVAAGFVLAGGMGERLAPFARTVFPTLEGLGIALLLPWASTVATIGREGWTRAVERVASWSYAIYLTNLAIAAILYVHLVLPRPAAGWGERAGWVVLFWVLTLVISAALYRWFELPVTAMRKRVGACRAFAAAARR